jgi:hypothetical protein
MPQLFSDYQTQLVSSISKEVSLPPGDAALLSSTVVKHVVFAPEGPELFTVAVCQDGITPIRYDLWASLGATLSLAGGAVGGDPIAAAIAVLGCLVTLRGIRRRVSDDEGYVVLALYQLGGKAPIETIADAIREMKVSMSTDQIRERVFDLVQLGAVSLTGDEVKLNERVMVRYTSSSQ